MNQNINYNYSNQQYYNNDRNKRRVRKSRGGIFFVLGVLLIGAGVFIMIFNNSSIGGRSDPTFATSSFEKHGDSYVLTDKNGNVLLDNINSHKVFCNGTTEIENKEKQKAIINDQGKFIVDYGKYSYIGQYCSNSDLCYCFYHVIDKETSQESILKYDGSILYSNTNDPKLKNVKLNNYSTTFGVLTTPDKYEVINFEGNTFLEFERKNKASNLEVLAGGDDRYTAIYYDGLTYVYNLNTFKEVLKPLTGKYKVKEVNTTVQTITIAGFEKTSEEDAIILFGYPNINDTNYMKTIVLNKDKVTFETDKCLNVAFVNGEVRCLIANGGIFEYYTVDGELIEK